jgi:hypothetical protein
MCADVVRVRQFLVLKRNGNWYVRSLGRLGVPYSSRAKAIRDAVAARRGYQVLDLIH